MFKVSIKTSEATNLQLDWLVAKIVGTLGQKPTTCSDCEHHEERAITDSSEHICHFSFMTWTGGGYFDDTPFGDDISVDYGVHQLCPIDTNTAPPYTTDWSLAGPIIEREGVNIGIQNDDHGNKYSGKARWWAQMDCRVHTAYGPTPLIAAMRCYITSRLGDKVEIPKELENV